MLRVASSGVTRLETLRRDLSFTLFLCFFLQDSFLPMPLTLLAAAVLPLAVLPTIATPGPSAPWDQYCGINAGAAIPPLNAQRSSFTVIQVLSLIHI